MKGKVEKEKRKGKGRRSKEKPWKKAEERGKTPSKDYPWFLDPTVWYIPTWASAETGVS
jgi:hypothetical protein